MAANDNRNASPRTTSFAGKHTELASDMPASFRKAPLQRREFDRVRDPYIGKQLKAMEQTEAQRRGESERTGRGSEMVRLDKPFPELRPKLEQTPIREAFNCAWLREQRAARLADLDRQRVDRHNVENSERAMQRDFEMKAYEQRMPQR